MLGMGELPDGPIIGYLTRSLAVMYAMHGAVLFFVSFDVRRFLPVVRFMAVLTVLCGPWLIALDVVVGMPVFWIVAEGPSLFILYCVVLWLTGHVLTIPLWRNDNVRRQFNMGTKGSHVQRQVRPTGIRADATGNLRRNPGGQVAVSGT